MNKLCQILTATTLATALVIPVAMGDHHEGDLIEMALSNPDRPEADKTRDADRKPGDVLAFFAMEPGMMVLETFAGGGYYTELLSRIVGPEGKVFSHNNQASLAFLGDELTIRFADNRLPNAEPFLAEANDIAMAENSIDLALNILNYHDIYWVPSEESGYVWPTIDAQTFLGRLYSALKPGGILGIIDHSAVAGSSSDSGTTVHRIDEQIVIQQVLASGFELVESAGFLRNPDDDRSLNVFDSAIRGKTDRFVLKFRKPLS